MPRRLLLLGLLLVLLLAARVTAQGTDSSLMVVAHAQGDTQGDTLCEAKGLDSTYSLTWWSADAGGTAGQPDAAPERSGGGYTLRAGFWQPSCVAAVVTPAIARTGNSITLSWTHSAANQAYQVHRATTPYFTPSDTTRRAIVTGVPWSYSDPDTVIGDPNTNYFYLVRATCGAAYVDPGRRGEFDFRLAPGSP